ncbi:CBS domain-containing protein [Nonomuraea soli]|uniref:CBS domain-containing protein n=1 Tax=Nonomuraea soli TaxID=1032476 RepID=A0A7W0CF09_9ACTN|nr:CBS domain-containing protein [Nonomuraea soli]MBA2889962.1 CBS domain-containing protein [Nonomuraea soli]
MLIREVMTGPVVTVHPTDSVRHAIRLLYQRNITAAPVIDRTGRVVGVVSELDLLRGEFEPDPRAHALPVHGLDEPPPRTVAEVMTSHVITVSETTDVTYAVDLMVGKRIKSLPVTRGDKLVGIVSRRDLMGMLARPDEDLRDDVTAALREQYPFGPRWEIDVHNGIAELSGQSNPYADSIADVIARTVPGIVRVRHRRIP